MPISPVGPRTRATALARSIAIAWALVAALVAAWPTLSWALDPARLPTQYRSTTWRAPAIPHDAITAVIEDREGWLWIGTVDGLARFDGARSEVFDTANTPGLHNSFIRDLAEDSRGRIWIGTLGGGLSVWEAGRIRHVGSEHGVRPSLINAIALYGDDQVWLSTNAGLLVGGDAGFAPPPGTEAIAAGSIGALSFQPDGSLLLVVDDGLMRYRDGHLMRIEGTTTPLNPGVRGLAATPAGTLVAGHGTWRIVDDRVEAWEPARRIGIDRVWVVRADRDNHVWLGTDGAGLHRLRDGRSAHIDALRGLAGDYVWVLTEDRRGNLWIGTNGGGLQVLRDAPVQVWGRREGLPDDFVRSLALGADGSIHVGTQTGGAARIAPDGTVTVLGTPGSANHRLVRGLVMDAAGTLWIGTGEGVDRWADGQWQRQVLPGLEDALVNVLAAGADGTVWVGTHADGYRAYRANVPLALPAELATHQGIAAALLLASDGSVWAGSSQSLLQYDGRQVRSYDTRHGLPNESIGAIIESPPGTLWIGTQGGLVRWRGGKFAALTRAQGLLDDRIKAALADADGSLWLGSYRGLQRIAIADIDAVLDGARARVDPQRIGLEHGLPSLEINGGSNAMVLGPGGLLYVGTRAGVAVLDPRRLVADQHPVPVRITGLYADDIPLDANLARALPPTVRRMRMTFTALDPARAAELRFSSRLAGFDTDWSAADSRREAEYTSLGSGEYSFHVRVVDADGRWSDDVAHINFTILPYWWESAPARAGAVVLFALAVWGLVAWRVGRTRGLRQALERQVAERTAEVEAANTRLARLSREDALTGVANRRRFDEALDAEWQRAARRGSPLALVMIDVDHFKAYNDARGHQAGDTCLRAVADVIAARHRRAGELVARYGGEEFVVLLPDTELADAVEAAEQLRRAVAELALPHPEGGPEGIVTTSLGVAAGTPGGTRGPGSLVQDSDRALYRAKAAGRNRVVVAESTC